MLLRPSTSPPIVPLPNLGVGEEAKPLALGTSCSTTLRKHLTFILASVRLWEEDLRYRSSVVFDYARRGVTV